MPLSFPDLPADHVVRADVPLRYEDVDQRGRLRLLAMPQVFAPTLFMSAFQRDPAIMTCWKTGVVPVLTRVLIEGGAGPIGVAPVSARAGYALAHGLGDDGAVSRVLLRMWAEIGAKTGSVYPPAPEGAGSPLLAGRVYAEDTFTRLFGPPDARRVTSLAFAGVEDPPGEALPGAPPAELLALPGGAEPFDADWHLDHPLVFGFDDTDANQHVNSMVTPQRFLDAALTRLATHGVTAPLTARRVEVRYRKPAFAGERVRIGLRTFSTAEGFGAVGFVTEADAPDPARARATIALSLAG